MAVEGLLENEVEALTRKVIELALGGNLAAIRLCFERLLSPRRDREVSFDLPKIESVLTQSLHLTQFCRAAWRGSCRLVKLPM